MRNPTCSGLYPHVFNGVDCPVCFDKSGGLFAAMGRLFRRLRRLWGCCGG